jgi:hypothetical protein
MARFEVFIPAASEDELNLTLRVTAETWMAALKIGLRKIGHGSMPADVLCDVKEDESIHVTDPRSGRVFRIAELAEAPVPLPVGQESGFRLASPDSDPPAALRTLEPAAPAPAAPAPAAPAPAAPAALPGARPLAEAMPVVAPLPLPPAPRPPRAQAVEPPPLPAPLLPVPAALSVESPLPGLPPIQPTAPVQPPPSAPPQPPAPVQPPVAVRASAAPSQAAPPPPAAAARKKAAARARKQEEERVEVAEVPAPRLPLPPRIGRTADEASVEEVLIELFEKSPAVFGKPREEALYYLLDLALEKIPAEAGSVYLADLNRRDLTFAAARGPKARELLALGVRIPMGRGFVGFCAQEGVTVAISDAASDPRFFKDISQRIGYPTRSVLTAPVLAGGRTLGAIQLINKRGDARFTHAELSILHYLAHQAALFLEAEG